MLVEGHPEMCPQVLRHGGIAALTIMLQTAGAQGKKAAAEALQVSNDLVPVSAICFLRSARHLLVHDHHLQTCWSRGQEGSS